MSKLTTEDTEATEDLLTKNMEFASVIRALRANAREDAKRIEVLERERDEAMETGEAFSALAWKLEKERNDARKERDEAREDFEEEKKFHHRTHGEAVLTQCKLLDARAFIEELVDLVAYGLGQHASIWSQAAMTKAREAISKAKTLEGAK